MGTKEITKNIKKTQNEPQKCHDLLQKTKPKQKKTTRSQTKATLEPIEDIYISNIPPAWTNEDMIKYLSFDKRASLINVSSLTYTVYGAEQSSKIATIKFEGKIDIEEFNDTIHQQQELGTKPLHSVECKFVRMIETESGKKSKAGKTKKSKKTRLPKNLETKANKEVIISNPREVDTVELKDSKSDTKEILSEIVQSTNFKSNVIANKNNPSGKITSTNHKEKHKKKKTDNTIFVSNIPFNVSRKELAEFLKVKENSISLPMSRLQDLTTGKIFNSKTTNKGYSFIRYENCDSNEPIEKKVEQLQGQILGNRKLMTQAARVKKDFRDNTEPTTIISVTRT